MTQKHTSDPTASIMAEIEEIKREAYQQGWRDAVQKIIESASQESGVQASPQISAPTTRKRARKRSSKSRGRAEYGIVPKVVEDVLRAAGDKGTTVNDIAEHAKRNHHDIAKSSIRARLRIMKSDGAAQRRGEHWFWAQKSLMNASEEQTAGNPHDQEPAARSILDQGGSHAAALA